MFLCVLSERLKRGAELTQAATACHAPTARERGYIGALRAFFESPSPNLTNLTELTAPATRLRALEQRLAKLASEERDDENAAVLHGLALLALGYYLDDAR